MPLLLQCLVGAVAVAAPLRRSLCTAAPRPPWAMVNSQAALDASGAPSQSARALVDLNTTPCVSHLSVPARLVTPDGDDMGSLVGIVRGASSDGLLLLDFIDARHRPLWPHEFATARGGVEPEGKLFVCNPLSGTACHVPSLLLQVRGGGVWRRVVRRFLSETGEWDERPLVGVAEMDPGRSMMINHEVLAFGDRPWWLDVAWGACSVDPFSDRPEAASPSCRAPACCLFLIPRR
ncbi:hypothetical protein VPH35_015737 [Triticum aestivum]